MVPRRESNRAATAPSPSHSPAPSVSTTSPGLNHLGECSRRILRVARSQRTARGSNRDQIRRRNPEIIRLSRRRRCPAPSPDPRQPATRQTRAGAPSYAKTCAAGKTAQIRRPGNRSFAARRLTAISRRVVRVVVDDEHAARLALRLEPPADPGEGFQSRRGRGRVVPERNERGRARRSALRRVVSPRNGERRAERRCRRPGDAPALVGLLQPPVGGGRFPKRDDMRGRRPVRREPSADRNRDRRRR